MYIKFLKTADDMYTALKSNLFQAQFYFENFKGQYKLDKAVVIAVSEDRSWKLPFTCPTAETFIKEYEAEKTALTDLFDKPEIPAPQYCWKCYHKKYKIASKGCEYLAHCLEGLKGKVVDDKVEEI